MKNRKIKPDDLLNKIAEGMGANVAKWDTIEETIVDNISFAKIVDTSKYMSKLERKEIKQKSQVY